MTVDSILKQLGDVIVNDLKKELKEQGHYLIGGIERSLSYKVKNLGNKIELDIVTDKQYAPYLEHGVKSNKIPYSAGSGAKSSKYIDGLTNYSMLRFGLDKKEAKKVAFKIAKRHKKEGMPTRNSYQYAQNGERKFFAKRVFNIYKKKWLDFLSTNIVKKLNADVANYITNASNSN